MKTRWAVLVPAVALALVGVLAVVALTRGANDATPTPVVPATATVVPPATPVPPTATAAATATTVPIPTATPQPVATQAQPAPPPPTVAPSATATVAPPPTATITSPLPTPSAPTSPLAPPKVDAAPPAPPAIVRSSASLAVNGQMVSYSYPSGWSLRQVTKDHHTVVTIEGPEGAIVTLTVYGFDSSPAQLSASLLDALKKQFSGATASPLTDTVGGLPAEGYTVRFVVDNIPMTGAILSLRGGRSAVTLYTQAADADLGVMQARFDVVKNTLMVR